MRNNLFSGLIFFCAFNLNAQVTGEIGSNDLSRGAYKTFEEFIRNEPSITDSFYVKSKERTHKTWIGTNSLTPHYFETNRRIRKIWGFCDGKSSYVLHQGEFFPINIEKDKYTFIGFDIIDNSGVAAAGLVGGAIGGGVYGAIAVSNAKSKKIEYKIDKITGEVVHPYRLSTAALSDEKVIIYRKAKKELGKPVEFLVNDTIKYSFIPNSFERLYFTDNVTSIKISYGLNFSDSLIIDRDFENEKYIQVTLLETDQIPRLIEVEESKGEFDSYKPEKIQSKREKTIGNTQE